MERKMLIALLILATMSSSGCAMSKMEATDVALEQARAESRAACVRARADADQARMAAIGAMEPGAQGYALMADAMARQAEAMVRQGSPMAPSIQDEINAVNLQGGDLYEHFKAKERAMPRKKRRTA